MENFNVNPIGKFNITKDGTFIKLGQEFIPAVQGLDGFSHISVIWWFSDFDNKDARSVVEVPKPYKNSPEVMGIFSTRSPVRPNPLALTAVRVLGIDHENGVIQIDWTDANDGTPVLDIKPYTPSADRIKNPGVPGWCAHWPKSVEESENFNWGDEFNF